MWDRLPAVPVIVMVKVPVGVPVEVATVIVLVKVGLPLCGLNPTVAPVGAPEADNVTV